ncbi:MAG: 50S ribosomal protein L18 [Flavobacteriales bacterium]|nr:50S ribosomal protein L18 [Flavobacteriales bacterium]|tara:strand:+ start:7424 stop:7774 length:351 start_codon:yes stop_codon:yes gene_type:complete
MSISKRRIKIKKRIRSIIKGTADFPRLTVFRSNKEIYASLVDDVKGVTICAASSLEKDVLKKKANKTEKASLVGTLIAERAVSAGIKKCAFDRNGYLYHGRVKSLANSAREGGLNF